MATPVAQFEVEGPTKGAQFWEALKKAFCGMKPLSKTKITILVISFTVFAIVCASLLGESFQYIEWNEYALKKNTASNDVDYSTIYESGRYFWGVNYEAVKFPKTIINVNFGEDDDEEDALTIFTDTGLEIQIFCSFQYQLIKEEIAPMFISFGNTYGQQVVSVARSILKNAAPNFLVEQYYQQRQLISSSFFAALQPGLRELAKVNTISFQLRHILLADEIVNKLLRIQVQLQVNLREQYVQSATIIRKETEALVAGVKANATMILAAANSTADLVRARANANAFKARETARKDGLAALYVSLNISTADQKLAYMYATGLASSGARLLVDTKGALVTVDGSRK